ncbi:hypothetical protein Taro_057024 [Colocasia esculenta]|uniref:Uncharacterized protein n=1 Tax=Colocasia esculenta TaxID=4460 RepID=A0A843XVF2_COLES|nr:hypothetical protein [Colocasia esculenta]
MQNGKVSFELANLYKAQVYKTHSLHLPTGSYLLPGLWGFVGLQRSRDIYTLYTCMFLMSRLTVSGEKTTAASVGGDDHANGESVMSREFVGWSELLQMECIGSATLPVPHLQLQGRRVDGKHGDG